LSQQTLVLPEEKLFLHSYWKGSAIRQTYPDVQLYLRVQPRKKYRKSKLPKYLKNEDFRVYLAEFLEKHSYTEAIEILGLERKFRDKSESYKRGFFSKLRNPKKYGKIGQRDKYYWNKMKKKLKEYYTEEVIETKKEWIKKNERKLKKLLDDWFYKYSEVFDWVWNIMKGDRFVPAISETVQQLVFTPRKAVSFFWSGAVIWIRYKHIEKWYCYKYIPGQKPIDMRCRMKRQFIKGMEGLVKI